MSEDLALPDAQDRPKVPAAYDREMVAAAIDALEVAAGGRQALIAAMVAQPATDPDLNYVIGLIADPRHDARRLSQLCKAGRVPLGTLIEAFKRGVYAQMTVQVLGTIARETPKVVEDIVARAQTHWVTCGSCQGVGHLRHLKAGQPIIDLLTNQTVGVYPDTVPCDRCATTGQVEEPGDLDRQKMVLTLAGLGPKPSGPGVVVDNRSVTINGESTAAPQAGPDSFASIIGAVDRILRRPARVLPPSSIVEGSIVVDSAGPPLADDQGNG
jgi:hypothetical protein